MKPILVFALLVAVIFALCLGSAQEGENRHKNISVSYSLVPQQESDNNGSDLKNVLKEELEDNDKDTKKDSEKVTIGQLKGVRRPEFTAVEVKNEAQTATIITTLSDPNPAHLRTYDSVSPVDCLKKFAKVLLIFFGVLVWMGGLGIIVWAAIMYFLALFKPELIF